jgi:hypothetical protein
MKGLMKICCGMTEKRSGMVTASARKMKAPTVKTDSKHNEDGVTLTGKGRWNLIYSVY